MPPVILGRRKLNFFDTVFLFLCVAVIPMLIAEYLIGVDTVWQTVFWYFYLLLWVLLTIEFCVKFSQSPFKETYLKHHWLDVVVIFFPFLRVLQLIRVTEMMLVTIIDRLAEVFSPRHKWLVINLVILVVSAVAIASQLILRFEKPFPNSPIHSMADAIWWAAVGISTVGVGNVVPVSPAGRGLTLVLIMIGIFIFGIITASIAAHFTEQEVSADISRELHVIEGDLNHVEQEISHDITSNIGRNSTKVTQLASRVEALERESANQKRND